MARISITPRLLLLAGLTFMLLQGVLTSIAWIQPEAAPGGWKSSMAPPSEARSRSKRCTCYSYRDKECVYYCHLDIIWINTPERTVPYGMSSYRGPQRLRRAVGGQTGGRPRRCVCSALGADRGCRDFCQSSPQGSAPNRTTPRGRGPG